MELLISPSPIACPHRRTCEVTTKEPNLMTSFVSGISVMRDVIAADTSSNPVNSGRRRRRRQVRQHKVTLRSSWLQRVREVFPKRPKRKIPCVLRCVWRQHALGPAVSASASSVTCAAAAWWSAAHSFAFTTPRGRVVGFVRWTNNGVAYGHIIR
jgi:hypothetical protein